MPGAPASRPFARHRQAARSCCIATTPSPAPAEVPAPRGRWRYGANCPFGGEVRRHIPVADVNAGAARATIVGRVGMDRDQEVGVVLPSESQRAPEGDGAVAGPCQFDPVATRRLQRAAQLLRRLQRDRLFHHSGHANRTRIAPAMAGVDDDERSIGRPRRSRDTCGRLFAVDRLGGAWRPWSLAWCDEIVLPSPIRASCRRARRGPQHRRCALLSHCSACRPWSAQRRIGNAEVSRKRRRAKGRHEY